MDVEVDFGLVDEEEVGMGDWCTTRSPASLPTSLGVEQRSKGELSGSSILVSTKRAKLICHRCSFPDSTPFTPLPVLVLRVGSESVISAIFATIEEFLTTRKP